MGKSHNKGCPVSICLKVPINIPQAGVGKTEGNEGEKNDSTIETGRDQLKEFHGQKDGLRDFTSGASLQKNIRWDIMRLPDGSS